MFKHSFVDLGYDDLITEEGNGKRLYVTPKHKYPSITTVLGAKPKPGLDEWRKRVGDKEADKVSKFASTRGTMLHELCERYINNDPDYMKGVPLHVKANFLEVKKHLDIRLSKVYAQECALYSDYLGIAGRVDLVGVWDNKNSIIDFKTSFRIKPREFCEDYFAQEAGYSIMWEERTGMPITQLVTVIAGDEGAQVFIEHRDKWAPKLLEAIEYYKSINDE